MKQYEIFASEGGYRIALHIVNGCPNISKAPWYATLRGARVALQNILRAR
jgi:hypothetical protein